MGLEIPCPYYQIDVRIEGVCTIVKSCLDGPGPIRIGDKVRARFRTGSAWRSGLGWHCALGKLGEENRRLGQERWINLVLRLHKVTSLGSDDNVTAAMVPRPVLHGGWETDYHGIYPEFVGRRTFFG